jgi:hypothetical protein
MTRRPLGQRDNPRGDGKPLDDQLRIEGSERLHLRQSRRAATLLQQFYDKADSGRAGVNRTAL